MIMTVDDYIALVSADTHGIATVIVRQRVNAAMDEIVALTSVDDIEDAKYTDAVVYGIKYRIAEMPGGTWFDPRLAQYHRENFKDEVRRIKAAMFNADGFTQNKSALI